MDLSGHERDKFFMSAGGKSFVDLSYLSGADGIEDGRSFARADLDRDGYEELIVINRNAPLLKIYRNTVGPAGHRRFVGVDLVGGATAAAEKKTSSSRDAVGARVSLRCGALKLTRELAMGSGFSTIDAHALTMGLDRCEKIDELSVRFPGGEKRAFHDLAVDRMYQIVEGKGLREIPNVYGRAAAIVPSPSNAPDPAGPGKRIVGSLGGGDHASHALVVYWATWCEACKREAPHVDALASWFRGRVDVVGPSLEPKDDAAAVTAYVRREQTAHRLLPFDPLIASATTELFGTSPALPASALIERASGRVLWKHLGTPTRSEIERSLSKE